MNITDIIGDEVFAEIRTKECIYNSIVLSAVESIFSIQAKFDAMVKPLVIRFAKRQAKMKDICVDDYAPAEFMKDLGGKVFDDVVIKEVFGNLQLTSSKNGIRKGDAVKQVVSMLNRHGIQTRKDLLSSSKLTEIEKDWRAIKGQGSGITWRYFLMLCGENAYFKDDTWMYRFFIDKLRYNDIRKNNDFNKLKAAFDAEYEKVKTVYPDITKSRLDFVIWKYMTTKTK